MKMRFAGALAALWVVTGSHAVAQTGAPETPAPAAASEVSPDLLALARRVMAITTPNLDKQVLDTMRAEMAAIASTGDADQALGLWMEKNAGPILLPHLHRLIDDMAGLYARHFTEDELRAMLAFYESPVGTRIASKQVTLGMEIEGIMAPHLESYAVDLVTRLCSENDCTGSNTRGGTSPKPVRR